MWLRLASVLAVLCIAGLAFAGEPVEANPGWKGTDFSGAEIDFPAVLQGKPTVLIFWATWCPYCRAFMPYLGEIQRDYGEDKINILAIDVFEDGVIDAAAYVEALGFPVIAVANGESIARPDVASQLHSPRREVCRRCQVVGKEGRLSSR